MLGSVVVCSLFALSATVGQQVVSELPPLASVRIMCIGLAAVLDPYPVQLDDVLGRHYNSGTSSVSCTVTLATRDRPWAVTRSRLTIASSLLKAAAPLVPYSR